MNDNRRRFLFSGHAVGAAAQFHRLDQLENLNHVVPTLGASVLPVTGGVSRGHASNYCFAVDEPRKRTLLAVKHVETAAHGRCLEGRFETEIEAQIEALSVVEKLHIGLVKLHMLATRADSDGAEAKVETRGSRIEGLELGTVTARVVLDDEPLLYCGSKDRLAEWYGKQSSSWRAANARRFGTDPGAGQIREVYGHAKFSLVREIDLAGTQDKDHPVSVAEDGYTIIWKGFGRIALGEVIVKGNERRITMVRLAMGSDAGGSGSVGDGSSNGSTGN